MYDAFTFDWDMARCRIKQKTLPVTQLRSYNFLVAVRSKRS